MGTPKQVEERGAAALEELKRINGNTEAPDEEVHGEDPPIEKQKTEHTEEDFKQKYKVLQGKYNAEIQELKEDIGVLNRQKNEISSLRKSADEQTKRNVELTQLLADVQKQLTKPKEEKAEVLDFIPSKYLSDAELKQLNDEDLPSSTLSLIGKMMQKVVGESQVPVDTSAQDERLDKLESDIKETKEVNAKTASNSFMDSVMLRVTGETDIDKASAAFDKKNKDANFIKWLGRKIPYSDKTISMALNDAGTRHDVNAVVKIFTDYDNVAKPEPKKSALENEIEPKPRTDTTVIKDHSVSDKALLAKWTPENVRKFYGDITKGVYRGKDDLIKKNEAEIWQANSIK